jgi:hypothetical protein
MNSSGLPRWGARLVGEINGSSFRAVQHEEAAVSRTRISASARRLPPPERLLEAVCAQFAQTGCRGERLLHSIGSCLGEEDLAAMPRRQHSRYPVEGGAKVVAVPRLRRPDVKGHTRAAAWRRATALLAAPWPGQGRGEGVGCRGEGGAELIADRLEDVPLVGFDGLAQDGVVVGEGALHGLGVLLPEPGAALDVGEEKGDGTGGQLGRCRPPPRRQRSRCAPGGENASQRFGDRLSGHGFTARARFSSEKRRREGKRKGESL